MVLVLPSKIDASYKKKLITMIGSYFTCIKKNSLCTCSTEQKAPVQMVGSFIRYERRNSAFGLNTKQADNNQ